jgi:hypothetical protein
MDTDSTSLKEIVTSTGEIKCPFIIRDGTV